MRSSAHGLRVGAERRVLGRRAHRELVAVGLAEDDRAGRFEPLDDRRVVGRDEVLEDARRRRWSRTPRVQMLSLTATGTPKSGRSAAVAALGVQRGRPCQHPGRVDVQERVQAAARARGPVEAGDPREQRLGHFGRRRLLAAYRLARLARGPLVDRAAHPITFGTRKRPEPRVASGALRRAVVAGQRRARHVGAQRRPIELDVRGRLDARRVDAADLLDVGEDGRQFAAEAGAFFGGHRQASELGDAQDVTV